MKARDEYYSRADRFSLGVDEETGRPYAGYLADPATALDFVNECRRRERDDLLMQKPGWNRGIPWW